MNIFMVYWAVIESLQSATVVCSQEKWTHILKII